jgi:hypothetical protein
MQMSMLRIYTCIFNVQWTFWRKLLSKIWPLCKEISVLLISTTPLSLSWEATSWTASQVFRKVSRNSKARYYVHKSLALAPVVSPISSVHTTPPSLSEISFNIVIILVLGTKYHNIDGCTNEYETLRKREVIK